MCKRDEGTPSASDIEEVVFGLEVQLHRRRVRSATARRRDGTHLLTNESQLVILELLKALLDVDIADDTRRVHHAGAEEPLIKVVASYNAQTQRSAIMHHALDCGHKRKMN